MASWKLAFFLTTVAIMVSLSSASITGTILSAKLPKAAQNVLPSASISLESATKMKRLAETFLSSASISIDSRDICSGVILNKRWIITTATFLHNYAAPQLRVSYGLRNRNDTEKTFEEVIQIAIHSEFNTKNVALIKTKFNIEFDLKVKPAAWRKKGMHKDDWVYAIGWKVVEANHQSIEEHENLMYYQTEIMGLDSVKNSKVLQILDGNVCTRGPYDERFPQLDYGSALMSKENELVGIACWYRPNYTTKVYVGIFANLNWINDAMNHYKNL